MKCPLRLKTQKRPLGEAAFGVPEQVEDFDNCILTDCAWWDEKREKCIICRLGELIDKYQTTTLIPQ
ncbi:hypothetical protein M0P98_06130 [bacterium]|jgi:hypothetical protein|nr:hypothetical protein [bacterium]